jgi:SAM-dependent methyltransferase
VTDPTDVTLAAYESGVEAYCAASSPTVAPAVAGLLDAIADHVPGGRVLELGSGPGLEADYLEQRGLTVDRTDASPAFVERLRRAGHSARLLDVRSGELGELGGPFDAVLAHAVLLHLARDDMEQALRACLAATRAGGVLAFTVKEGDGEDWSDAKLDAPRWFVYWRPQPLRELLERTGWNVIRLEQVQGRHEPWLQALCRR